MRPLSDLPSILIHPLVEQAYLLAVRAHGGQTRRNGTTPYIEHVQQVMLRTPNDPVLLAVAALHDTVEDARIRFSDLEVADLPREVLQGVATLTRQRKVSTGEWAETYETFIARVKTADGGRWVSIKVADILSNLADSPTSAQVRRYAAALLILVDP
jgi:(p)ppGpp synthase/HD superfamily hydrolase